MANDTKKVDTKKGVADSQLANLTRTKLIDELKRRGYSTKQLMDQDGLTGPEIEALATSGNEMNKGGMGTKNRIGGNDYRKGGYVLNTVDNRKKMS
jgi:hypothetical protein